MADITHNVDNNRFKTCLNRFLGHCSNCSRDYNENHHPNNLDCPNYVPLDLLIAEVERGGGGQGGRDKS